MHIYWGKKNVYKRLGYVAEFCPICRDITPFIISRIGLANHINSIALDEGVLLRHIGECNNCKIRKSVDVKKYKNFALSILNQPNNNINNLIALTYPNVRLDYADQLEIKRKIKERFIFSPAEREVLVSEPFMYLTDRVLQRYSQSKLDKEGGIGCVIILILLVLPWIIPSISSLVCPSNIFLFFFGVIYTLLQFRLARNRFVKREIIPLLVKTLLPLNPKQDEITQCLNKYRIFEKYISAEQLWEQLQKGYNPYH